VTNGRLAISVRTATGSGRTPLSAFDDALFGAGVHDFNLITLSSVIPPRTDVVVGGDALPMVHGDKLYCVLSVANAELRGETTWAGIGWVYDEEVGGLFVEHHSGSEESLRELIDLSLGDMARRRGRSFGEVHYALTSAHCEDLPVCALAVATYGVESWDTLRG